MIEIGSTVGNYRVMRKLGSGSMGSVYLAEHPMIGKRVALKVIHSDLADNEEMVSRFFNEARAVTLIGHENIIEVIDFGQTPDGENFIVMELLEGRSLGDRLKAEPILPLGDTLHIAAQIADGLFASHQRGIVHRDLKPDNVYLIARDGDENFVKILDFGLAKLTQGGGALSHKTRAGSVLGTPHYMAPEQCEGKPDIDHRVDVYALGCILYQCLCGRVPFPGEGFGEVLVKHLREPPVMPSKVNPDIPREIEAVILQALAKRKEFRFQSMREMAQALRAPEAWAQEMASTALLRATGEMESVLGEAREDTATNVTEEPPLDERAMPTALDREVPPEVASLGGGGAGVEDGAQARTRMLEAPDLPAPIAVARTTMGEAPASVTGSFDAPQNSGARRFMIGALAAAVVAL